jgi:hypothetical protein
VDARHPRRIAQQFGTWTVPLWRHASGDASGHLVSRKKKGLVESTDRGRFRSTGLHTGAEDRGRREEGEEAEEVHQHQHYCIPASLSGTSPTLDAHHHQYQWQ